ncbi:MAG TPA: NAD-dependent epimerase/dehydratase family protein [Micromonosporaceae bacterium]
MGLHVVVGAGPVGSAAALCLAQQGHRVRVITRRGTGPDHPDIEPIAADARDAGRLAELARGADGLYNCANPAYHRWPTDWPPIAAALLQAAQRCDAVLVTMSNLYGYGPVARPMTEDLPLAATTVKGRIRAQMWRDVQAAGQAGLLRATEARASDFVGAEAQSIFTQLIAAAVLRGRTGLIPAALDLPHTLTYVGDAGRFLATLGTDPRSVGRAWHVPSPPPTTLREAARRLAELAGAPEPRLRRAPGAALRLIGVVNPEARELVELRYQFERPFVLDASAAEATFGFMPTSLDQALLTMVPAQRRAVAT